MKNIRYLKGVGEKRAAYFEKLGITTVSGLISLYPRRYDDLSETVDLCSLSHCRGQKVAVRATVRGVGKETRIHGGKTLTAFYIEDDTTMARIVFFNNKYIKNTLRDGKTYVFYGKIPEQGEASFTNPEIHSESVLDGGGILPIYPLVSGLSQKLIRNALSTALTEYEFSEPLPESVLKKYSLCPYRDAIFSIHKPQSKEQIAFARKRLIFEELLYYSLGLRLLRKRAKTSAALVCEKFDDDFIAAHDFEPTSAQAQAIAQIRSDFTKGIAMNRLLQGDVGSGKTLVAACSAYDIVKNGGQAVVMVPTEVLANQHYRYFEKMLTPFGINVGILTASVTAAQKRSIKKGAADGSVQILIGTHALLQKDVSFKNLALVITDEQHRFGVMQRSTLAGKGEGAHILVMSATPIPRTLALMLWGDLDLSVIDVMPSGRQKVSTYLVDSGYSERLQNFIKKNTDAGGRVYVVCPMVEESEGIDISAATERYAQLCEIFGQQNVGLMHGKMKGADKDKVMQDFAEGRISILVSTTVIEVGVNVPEATLMIIENAERFGLSQLHQLRGRVGRGSRKSYCVLVSDSKSERLEFFTKTTDGFRIANKDLELRGPGNFFGRDQHGLPQMQIADMQQDMTLLSDATECAGAILKTSPDLNGFEKIRKNVLTLFDVNGEIFN